MEHFYEAQKLAISQLKETLNDELPLDYMKEDEYLAKWLRDKEYSVEEAASLLREHLKWREEQNVNTVLQENWDDMHIKFPYTRNMVDKEGRPVLYIDLGKWDIYNFIKEEDTGSDRLERYFVKILEESEAHVRKIRSEQKQNITQFNLIVNLDGFSVQKHGRFKCLYFYRNLGNILGPHFPGAAHRIVMVNVPYLFQMTYLFLSEETRKSISLLGNDRAVWEATLLQFIARNQVPGDLLKNSDIN